MSVELFNRPLKNAPIRKVQLSALFILSCGQFQIQKLLGFEVLREYILPRPESCFK